MESFAVYHHFLPLSSKYFLSTKLYYIDFQVNYAPTITRSFYNEILQRRKTVHVVQDILKYDLESKI